MDYLLLFLSLGVILLAAELFTNGIEWLGVRLRLTEGAVGSIFAAVGTALPESLIPLIAFLFGKGVEEEHIGVGAIFGAPFMLSTLAFFISGLVVVLGARGRPGFPNLLVDATVLRRDLFFFAVGYGLGLVALGVRPFAGRLAIALLLGAWYAWYAFLTLREGKDLEAHEGLRPLFFQRRAPKPRLALITAQVLVALGLLIGGAEVFVDMVARIAAAAGVSPFFLSLLIAPVATELPEKFNSIIWLRQRKDTLALGNITGAMTFQGTLLPAAGMLLTDWKVVPGLWVPVVLTYASVLLVMAGLSLRKQLSSYSLLAGGLFYLAFLFLSL